MDADSITEITRYLAFKLKEEMFALKSSSKGERARSDKGRFFS